ncbi:MAG: HD domain-containing protein [Ignavibacteriae bacterium]|nr:HD domain-containing protein [Ignavibacteriota bacterium]
MISERLIKQAKFINEIEKLKLVLRSNGTLDPERPENSAEHSWHISLMAILFIEHSSSNFLDILKVIKMLLIHDLVEIDVGDTFLYLENQKTKFRDEQLCAQRLFNMLPEDQANEFMSLWYEFEARETEEAKYAAAIDGLHPLLNHLLTGDTKSEKLKIPVEKVIAKKIYIKEFAPALWELADTVIKESVDIGLYE